MDTTVKLEAAKEGDKEPGLPYREVIGALMYLATSTRPDLAFPVGYLSRHVQHPNAAHAGALKRILRYLVATSDHGVLFKNQDNEAAEKLEIDGYVDADWGNCPDTKKSVTGYVMMMAGGPVT
ncbi:putative transposon Ty5-1 protein [Phytophthora infestans]|uniref:Putative transposon Ty5-1 protein n=1 Tax=Phytophthora infestans TaxID=4787 RepID=A0A8S9TUC1_PHYIN|nr:putative transposon Ty5-1 protein [Phytophthora infestans]